MKRTGILLGCLLASTVLVGSAAAAHRRHVVPCAKIKDAIAAGKTAEDVEKDMNVSATRVKNCTAMPSKSSKKAPAKKAS